METTSTLSPFFSANSMLLCSNLHCTCIAFSLQPYFIETCITPKGCPYMYKGNLFSIIPFLIKSTANYGLSLHHFLTVYNIDVCWKGFPCLHLAHSFEVKYALWSFILAFKRVDNGSFQIVNRVEYVALCIRISNVFTLSTLFNFKMYFVRMVGFQHRRVKSNTCFACIVGLFTRQINIICRA